MTITLTLTPAEELLLREKAAQSGQTPEAFLLAPLQIANMPTEQDTAHVSPLPDDTHLRAALMEIIAEGARMEFTPGMRPPGQEAEIEELIAEKFRKQGLNV